jgi:beta-lactamase regulating signal transducer with metallopeptidase domain/ribosomal protein L7Ae-like RNA K-turn-binding protein
MSTFFVDPAMSAALWIIIKTSVVLGIAAIVQALLRQRASAETRHLVWTLAIVGLLLLPILSLALPGWPVVIRTAATNTTDVPVVINGVQEPADSGRLSAFLGPGADAALLAQPAVRISASMVIPTVYAAGVLVMLLPLGMQWRNVRRLAREASDVQDSAWTRLFNECAGRMGVHRPVRLLRSRERSMPMAWGTCRPAILIPAIAETWAENRRRAVILHELAHVARYDCLTQTLAFAACALYWFHPAAWWVARRLRIERELACDDRVIAAGTHAREYAGHLLEIAYTFGHQRAPALAVSMARPRQLESRMLAALDAARNRSVPALRVRLAGAAMAAALLLSLAAARPTLVAAEMNTRRAPARATAPAARPQDAASAPHLKPVEGILIESASRMARAAAAAIGIAQDNLPGTWEIRPTSTEGTVHLRLVEVNSSSGSNIPIERLEGLTAAQLAGAGGSVQFRLRRDAGTFTFEGVLRNGVGAGTFSFTSDPNFPAELAKRGFARPTTREQYQMARHDVGYAFVDELNTQGYSKPQTSELVRAGQHGVHVIYLREMGALGYRLGSLEPLITLRDHGVTPAYIRELAEQGYKGLPADELRRARDHGISPEYVRGMREAGYGSLPMDELIKARDHGVTPEFVRELGDAGHRKLPLDQLIRVRDHGVSPEYVRQLRQLGHGLPIEELVRARDHGVTQEYVRAMRDAGHGSLTMEQLIKARDHGVDVEFVRGMATLGYGSVAMESLIRLRDHGVTPKYVQELKTLGYDRLAIEDLVTLRSHGLTPDRIRAANARAGTRLPIDMLKSLAAGGMR